MEPGADQCNHKRVLQCLCCLVFGSFERYNQLVDTPQECQQCVLSEASGSRSSMSGEESSRFSTRGRLFCSRIRREIGRTNHLLGGEKEEDFEQAFAAGTSMAVLRNLRYQLIWGMDRRLDLYSDVPKVSLALCLALPFINVGIGTWSLNWVWSEDQGVFANGFALVVNYKKTKAHSAEKKKRVIRKSEGF